MAPERLRPPSTPRAWRDCFYRMRRQIDSLLAAMANEAIPRMTPSGIDGFRRVTRRRQGFSHPLLGGLLTRSVLAPLCQREA